MAIRVVVANDPIGTIRASFDLVSIINACESLADNENRGEKEKEKESLTYTYLFSTSVLSTEGFEYGEQMCSSRNFPRFERTKGDLAN